jgi:hypothetical protein
MKSENGSGVKTEAKVKNEPIDLDSPAPARASVAKHREAIPAKIENVDDVELERKKAKARALAEVIEAEERLAKFKRNRLELEDEIAAAERKKQRHGSE